MATTSTQSEFLSVDVRDLAGDTVGSVDLPTEWFDGTVNIGVMHDVVTAQQAAARQGTHKTKSRGEVRGGGAKPWRQKGTGRARHGSIRSPIWVGGGVAHGRTPKDWSKRVNKKVRRAALRSALTDRASSFAVVVVRELAFASPRTKDAVAALDALELTDRKVLVVLAAEHEATIKSFRNLGDVHLLEVDQLNTYDVLAADVVVFDEAAVALLADADASDEPDAEAVDAATDEIPDDAPDAEAVDAATAAVADDADVSEQTDASDEPDDEAVDVVTADVADDAEAPEEEEE